MSASNYTMEALLNCLPQEGRLEWIGIRPKKNANMQSLSEVDISIGGGLNGDRYQGKAHSKRQVTIIQAEHIGTIASLAHAKTLKPALLRRNLVVSGINLLALKGKTFTLGTVVLEYTGLCHPCSKMEKLLGPGGYNAMRGHGGITTRVLEAGTVSIGDRVKWTGAQV